MNNTHPEQGRRAAHTTERNLLLFATAALRDIACGFPHDEIAGPNGSGLEGLLVDLVTHLRGRGIDDEHGWDCHPTAAIPVASPRKDLDALLVEDLTELRRMGLNFAAVTGVFGQSAEESVYVAAAQEFLVKEGQLEVDDRAVVSYADDEGAYVSAWAFVERSQAGILPAAEALELLLDAVRTIERSSGSVRMDPMSAAMTPETWRWIYADWLEDLISNYADELDAMTPKAAPERAREQLEWFDFGQTFRFFPSDALNALCDFVAQSCREARAARAGRLVADSIGLTLDRVVTTVQTPA